MTPPVNPMAVSISELIHEGILGPTEVRIIISLLLALEVIFPGSILYVSAAITIFLFFANLADTRKVLKIAAERDAVERKEKEEAKNAEKKETVSL